MLAQRGMPLNGGTGADAGETEPGREENEIGPATDEEQGSRERTAGHGIEASISMQFQTMLQSARPLLLPCRIALHITRNDAEPPGEMTMAPFTILQSNQTAALELPSSVHDAP